MLLWRVINNSIRDLSPTPAMDTLSHSLITLAQLPCPEISIFVLSVVFVCGVFKIIVLKDDEERPVNFRTTVPEQCLPEWKGEVLEDPAIKVPFPST